MKINISIICFTQEVPLCFERCEEKDKYYLKKT